MGDTWQSRRELFVAIGSIVGAAAAHPKPGAHTNEVYEQAFLGALG